MKTLRLLIRGRVQGVWFRESMRREAARLGVTGWVRNRPDGSVEAVAQGPAKSIDALIEWARKGPPLAHVSHVTLSAADDADGCFSVFEKRAD